VNQQYQTIIALPTEEEIERIRNNVTAYYQSVGKNFDFSLDAGFEWLSGLSETINALEVTPTHQELERETRLSKTSIRRVLYKQKGIKREYHVYYTIRPLPAPDPNFPNLVARVVILFVRHASQKPLTTKELKARISAVTADIAEIDALRQEAIEGV
jgi:hypothetical protein